MIAERLSVGDVITIPRDQYGKPVLAFDPETKRATAELQRFRVLAITDDAITLEAVR